MLFVVLSAVVEVVPELLLLLFAAHPQRSEAAIIGIKNFSFFKSKTFQAYFLLERLY